MFKNKYSKKQDILGSYGFYWERHIEVLYNGINWKHSVISVIWEIWLKNMFLCTVMVYSSYIFTLGLLKN